MEFEEMQVIWNSQNDEKLYAINEQALHDRIRRKGQSVNRLVGIFEWIMIVANLLVGVVLAVEAFYDQESLLYYVLPALYLAYGVFALVRRLTRRKAGERFAPTVLGELDKALWQINFLINQSRTIIVWYLLPIFLVASVYFLLNGKWLWALVLGLVIFPATFAGSRWEVNRYYVPKKRALESLRETLLTPPPG